jgi:hypothetical protein
LDDLLVTLSKYIARCIKKLIHIPRNNAIIFEVVDLIYVSNTEPATITIPDTIVPTINDLPIIDV